MSNNGQFSPDMTPFEEAAIFVEKFEAMLKTFGIEVRPGSKLETFLLDLIYLKNMRAGPDRVLLPPRADFRLRMSHAMSILDLVKRLVLRCKHNAIPQVRDHLELLNKGNPAQNALSLRDETANKTFELLLALVGFDAGTNVEVDDPNSADGKNPDVLFDYKEERWGLACKILNNDRFSPEALMARMTEGIRQIECSPAGRGLVVVNGKNLIDPNRVWPLTNETAFKEGSVEPEYGAWLDRMKPAQILHEHTREWAKKFKDKFEDDQIAHGVKSKKDVIPGVLFFLQAGTGLQTPHGPAFTIVSIFDFMQMGHISQTDASFVARFNHLLQVQTQYVASDLA